MKPLVSVHVVHYSCSNCGEEIEEAKMCKECSAPMRVIQVVELYGDEANEFLENLKTSSEKKEEKVNVCEVQFDESVMGADVEEEEDFVETDDLELGEIFPDEDDDSAKGKTFVDDLGDDFEAALGVLDQEEEELGEDIGDLPEL